MGAGAPVAACAPSWPSGDRAPSGAFGMCFVVALPCSCFVTRWPGSVGFGQARVELGRRSTRYHQARHSLRPNRHCMHMHWRLSLQLRVGPALAPRRDVAVHWMCQHFQTGSLNMAELTDLVGEAQALPSLAVATWPLLLGALLEGVWTG